MSMTGSEASNRLRVLRLDEDRTEVPLARPAPVSWADLSPRFEQILSSGMLTNGPTVRELEAAVARWVGVRHCVAVSSCTAGLMLVLQAADLQGEVIVPSFTFSATAHAVAWNGVRPVFADCDRRTLTITPDTIEAVAGPRTSAIIATHVFGTPCDVDALDATARKLGLPLIYDAAHAFGSLSQAREIGGFGSAEVFSLSATKPLLGIEGGLITTNDDELARRCRLGRDYGNPGDYDCRFPGLNARMSELHAAVALDSLITLDDRVERRNALASAYHQVLGTGDGITFPEVRHGDRSTYKDFTIMVEPERREPLREHLRARGIETRTYYAPPVHLQTAYRGNGWGPTPHLPVTEDAARRVLTLPMWSEMTTGQIERVVEAVLDGPRA